MSLACLPRERKAKSLLNTSLQELKVGIRPDILHSWKTKLTKPMLHLPTPPTHKITEFKVWKRMRR